ncbi:MAG: glycosyltransferase family 2 protein [Ferruginibacter sp.]
MQNAANYSISLPEVAIVILNWNGRKYLEQFLPSVMSSTYANKRVIVADNASTDDSVSFLKQNYPQVELLINPTNEGFAKGYNTALKQVTSDYYVLLNSDVEVTPGWIEPVIELMESDWHIACCQPKLLAYHRKDHFEYAGAAGGWLDHLGYPFARGRIFEDCEADAGQYDNAADCFWATGAAMFVRAAVYHEMKGLDEYFFAHQEEIDFCWRLQLAGYKVMVQPASVVYHVGGGTLPQGNKRKTFLNFRNNLIMLYKNLSAGEALKKIPFRFVLDGIAGWKALFSGDATTFIMIIKAHLHFLWWLFFEQKQSVFPTRTGEVSGAVYRGSIVWDYFIKKKKTFSEIVGNK